MNRRKTIWRLVCYSPSPLRHPANFSHLYILVHLAYCRIKCRCLPTSFLIRRRNMPQTAVNRLFLNHSANEYECEAVLQAESLGLLPFLLFSGHNKQGPRGWVRCRGAAVVGRRKEGWVVPLLPRGPLLSHARGAESPWDVGCFLRVTGEHFLLNTSMFFYDSERESSCCPAEQRV